MTVPTARMIEAMSTAKVGDDVLGDDPTVQKLEQLVAHKFGFEAGLLMPSGTMSNQVGVAAHVQAGEELLLEVNSHLFQFEGGGLARVAGAHVRTMSGEGGMLPVEEMGSAVRPPSVHMPRTGLFCLEQTHLFSGGSILPREYLEEVRALSLEAQVPVYIDGARIWNALAETGTDPTVYGVLCDSMRVSLCKGMSCPVGSLLLGDGAYIERAKRIRKWMGGGMRQAGYLAACGVVALEEMLPLIGEDNARCRRLGGAILGIDGLQVAQPNIDTNVLFVEVTHPQLDAPMVEAALQDHDVLALALGERLLRFVTHRGVNDHHVERAAGALQAVLADQP
ncbi:MAG: beta-eliminating lyase-related protein [Planctomycetes bacterium]|nr:beta-eliminating lyase-related protein [Planctomycetota bacterium]